MTSTDNRTDPLARAKDLKIRGESARRRDGAAAVQLFQESVALYRDLDEPLALAHTIRHLGDVYCEEKRIDLAEPCYHEALSLYRKHEERSPLDLANCIRSLAVLRWEQAKALWADARDLYNAVGVEAGVKESATRIELLSQR